MCLISVLWCPLRFPHKNDVRFVFTTSCLSEGSCLIYVCLCYSGVQHILCCVFALFVFVLCALCYQFLWIVNFLLSLRYSLTFIKDIRHSIRFVSPNQSVWSIKGDIVVCTLQACLYLSEISGFNNLLLVGNGRRCLNSLFIKNVIDFIIENIVNIPFRNIIIIL